MARLLQILLGIAIHCDEKESKFVINFYKGSVLELHCNV